MSDERVLAGIMVLVEHYLGGRQSTDAHVRAAFDVVGVVGNFEDLGEACFCGMLRLHIKQLQARRSALVDELAESPKPPLH